MPTARRIDGGRRALGRDDSGPRRAGALGDLTCSVQADSFDYDAPDAAAASATAPGNVVVLPPTLVEVEVAPGHDIALCSELTWTTDQGTFAARHDYAHNIPGDQRPIFV